MYRKAFTEVMQGAHLVKEFRFSAWLRCGMAAVLLGGGVAAVRAQDVVVGQLASVTSPVTKIIAKEYHAGIELAFQRINAAGGVQGRRLRLQLMDDQYDPTRTLLQAQELVEKHGAVALVGGLGTPTTMRLVKEGFLEKHRIGNFAPLTGLPAAHAAAHVFPVRADFNDEVKAMLAHAASLGRKRVAYVYFQAGAGPALSELVPQWAEAARLELVANVGFANEADPAKLRAAVDRAVDALGAQAPDAVVLLAVGPAHAEGVKALRQRYGTWLPVYSLGQINLDDLVVKAGADGARGVSLTQVMPSPRSVEKGIAREFSLDRLKWKPETPATYMSLEGYVAGRVLAEVMQRAKELSREGVLASAYGAGELDVAGFRVLYRKDIRKSLHPVDVTLIDRDGRLIR